MAKQSAGILLYRLKEQLEVFLVHPGGPFFARKDLGVWTIPKGEFLSDEDPLEAAKREFAEETGQIIDGEFIRLQPITQKGGKQVLAWALAGDLAAETIVSNTFELIWPPKSGRVQTFPEIDRATWFTIVEARQKINEKQIALLNELTGILEVND